MFLKNIKNYNANFRKNKSAIFLGSGAPHKSFRPGIP